MKAAGHPGRYLSSFSPFLPLYCKSQPFRRWSSKPFRHPLSGLAILITLQNMTDVTNAHVYGTCLKMFGVMNIKIGCKKLEFRTGDNTERGSVMMCFF